MPMIKDHVKQIITACKELENVDTELDKNEFCLKMAEQRFELLQKIVDNARPALSLAAAEVRRYRGGCSNCHRCDEEVEDL